MAKEVLEMEVKSNIKSVTKETDALGKSIGKASNDTKDLDKGLEATGKSGSKGFKAIGTAVKGFGTALKAAGIGLIVALFVTLKEALERNQKVMNTVNTIMSTVSTTFNQVADVLTDVVSWVTQSTDRFDGLGKVMGGIGTLILTPFKNTFLQIKLAVLGVQLAWEQSFFGGKGEDLARINELQTSIIETGSAIKQVGVDALNAGKDIITNFGDAVGEIGAMGKIAFDGISDISIKANIELAKATTAAQNSSKLAEAAIQGLIEKNDKLAETQRQIRDDETKTFAERIEANNELNNILDKQEQEMLKLADTRVASAALELSANKENVDLQVAYQQTLNDRAGVEAQIAGFRSEQMTNEVSLDKELLEIKNQLRVEALEGMARELEELKIGYDAQVEMARKSGVDITEITAQYEKEQSKIKIANAKATSDSIKTIDDKLADTKKKTLEMGAAAAMKIAGEGSAIGKSVAVAMAIMNTKEAVTAALGAKPYGPWNIAQAVATGIFGMTQVQGILSTPTPGGGGGGSAGSIGAAPQTPAPQMTSGAFDLSGGVAPDPVQAFVITDSMTNSQNQLANIRRRATI